jgi:hypothetical protein
LFPPHATATSTTTPLQVLLLKPTVGVSRLNSQERFSGVLSPSRTTFAQFFISDARGVFKIGTFIAKPKALFLKASPYLALFAVPPKVFLRTQAAITSYFFLRDSNLLSYGIKHFASIIKSTVDVTSSAIDSASADQFCLQTGSTSSRSLDLLQVNSYPADSSSQARFPALCLSSLAFLYCGET